MRAVIVSGTRNLSFNLSSTYPVSVAGIIRGGNFEPLSTATIFTGSNVYLFKDCKLALMEF